MDGCIGRHSGDTDSGQISGRAESVSANLKRVIKQTRWFNPRQTSSQVKCDRSTCYCPNKEWADLFSDLLSGTIWTRVRVQGRPGTESLPKKRAPLSRNLVPISKSYAQFATQELRAEQSREPHRACATGYTGETIIDCRSRGVTEDRITQLRNR